MISKKSIIATVIVSGSVLAITLGTASIALASNDSANIQFGNNSFILAQAQQDESNKHRHGQNHESEQDGHKQGEVKGGHGKDKGEGDKHGDKKSDGMMKEGHDYAHMIISYADTLKLSDEQLGKIVRLHLKHEQAHKQLKEKLMKSMKAFQKESMKLSTSDTQLRKLGKDHADAFNAMVEHHVNERHAIHAILFEDQKKQLNAMKMDHDKHDDNQGGGHNHH